MSNRSKAAPRENDQGATLKTSRAGRLIGLVATLIVLVSVPGVALADDAVVSPIDITVAPSTLNLSHAGDCVTVHADLAFTVAEDFDWYLNDVPANFIFADDCDDLVARFDVDALSITTEPSFTMTFTGKDALGAVCYEGSDDVRVIDVKAAKKKGK